ncbi:MAG: hypothetical protein HY904_00275 [Deltaproteobacteria bacterium]|nr:hypothetical protein [Deltaproteobacteria bacterium]
MASITRRLAGGAWQLAGLLGVTGAACTTTTSEPDAGTGIPSGIAYADIGSPCQCDLSDGTGACARNPTNTCAKSALTCVIFTPDETTNNAGNPWWEAPLFSRITSPDGGFVIEGECTLTAPRELQLFCPTGTVAVQLSTGMQACKRMCVSDQECSRSGWVCDQPLLDRVGIDRLAIPTERGFDIDLCRPACSGGFPDCLRSTPCTMGRPGCFRSAYTRNAPMDLGIYVGDRNGGRVCNAQTGHCDVTALRNEINRVGGACASNEDCPTDHLCITDNAYANPPVGAGFCTYADCDPNAQPGAAGSCNPALGITCERAFEHGMCFPDCRGGTLCDVGQKCSMPDMFIAGNLNPNTGQPLGWKQNQCVDCGLTGVCP